MSKYDSSYKENFRYRLRNVAEDFNLNLDGPFGKEFHKAIDSIEKNPHPDDNLKIHNDIHGEIAYVLGWNNKEYLIIYEINEEANTITFLHFRHFKEFEAYYEIQIKEI
jgi:mRNA-degrading endonuclease RelE of RelBE toxin-antitoxin system